MREQELGQQANTSQVEIASTITNWDVIYASIVAFFAWLFSVYDFILFGTLLPVIAQDFKWSTATSTGIATWVALGTFLVSLLVGPITDYFGRRNALVITVGGAAISSGLTAFTPSALYLIIVRALSGFGYSEQAVNTTYLSEIYGPRRRGFIYSFIQGGWPIGVLFASFMAIVLLPAVGWRGVFLVSTLPIILILLLRFKLKESPRYEHMVAVRQLETEGRTKEAEELGREYGIDADRSMKFTYVQLFGSDVRKHTIFLGVAFLLNWFAVQIFAVLGTTVLTQGKGISFSNSLFLLILSNALAYVGYVAHGYIGDVLGRRETVAGAWILSGISYTIMLFLSSSYLAVLIAYSVGLFFLIGSYSALFTYMGESFPTRIRGTGSSFINAMGPIGGVLGSLLFTTVLQSGANVVNATMIAGAIPLILSGLLMFGARRVPPQKTLEEIAI
jgi:MFS family permease